MQISVEKRDGLECCMTVELPKEDFEQTVAKRLSEIARTVKMDGFRPGKVPLNVVKKRFGNQARREALEDSVQSSLYEAFSKEDLRPAGSPNIEFAPLEEDAGPKYMATFELMPEVVTADMKGVKIEIPKVEISTADIEATLERIREQRPDWKGVDRAAKDGDRITIDFVGTLDGVAFDGGTAQGVPVDLGAGKFIPDFEKGLMGLKAADEKSIDATFPEEYGNKDLAGKTVQFATTVVSVEESSLPEIDDEFIKTMGVEEGGIDALHAQIKDNMERELVQALREVAKTAVMDALIAEHKIELPQVMVKDEIGRLNEQMRQMMAQQGVPMPEGQPVNEDLYRDQAERRVSLGLIMSELVGKQALKASPEQVDAQIAEIAGPYEDPAEIVRHYSNPEHRADVEAVVLEQCVVDWVLAQAETVDKEQNFEDFMKTRQG